MFRDDLTDILRGICVVKPHRRSRPDRDHTVPAGKFKTGVISQKCISSPSYGILQTLQDKTMPADSLQRPEHLNRGPAVRENRAADRHGTIVLHILSEFFYRGGCYFFHGVLHLSSHLFKARSQVFRRGCCTALTRVLKLLLPPLCSGC